MSNLSLNKSYCHMSETGNADTMSKNSIYITATSQTTNLQSYTVVKHQANLYV